MSKKIYTRQRPKTPIQTAPKGRYHTRDGALVTILAHDIKGRASACKNPDTAVGIVHRAEYDIVFLWKEDGAYFGDKDHYLDLFELVEVVEDETYYVNHYGDGNFGQGFRTIDEAENAQCSAGSATIEVVVVKGSQRVITAEGELEKYGIKALAR